LNRRIHGVQQMCPRASPMSTSRHFSECVFRAKALSKTQGSRLWGGPKAAAATPRCGVFPGEALKG
jgi:hypothetical protein